MGCQTDNILPIQIELSSPHRLPVVSVDLKPAARFCSYERSLSGSPLLSRQPVLLLTTPSSVYQALLLFRRPLSLRIVSVLEHFKSQFPSSLLPAGQNSLHRALCMAKVLIISTYVYGQLYSAVEINKSWVTKWSLIVISLIHCLNSAHPTLLDFIR
jgi:hypothetical protein